MSRCRAVVFLFVILAAIWTARSPQSLAKAAPASDCLLLPARNVSVATGEFSLRSEQAEAFRNPLPNFRPVSLGLFRSGQPSKQGIRALKGMGFKTFLKFNGPAWLERRDARGR